MYKKWVKFLSDDELLDDDLIRKRVNGRFLLGKIVHDVLHCLNGIRAMAHIKDANPPIDDYPEALQNWLNQINDKLAGLIVTVSTDHQSPLSYLELAEDSTVWPDTIRKIGQQIADAPILLQSFDELLGDLDHDLVDMTRHFLQALKEIHADIENQAYKKILTIDRYWSTPSSDS